MSNFSFFAKGITQTEPTQNIDIKLCGEYIRTKLIEKTTEFRNIPLGGEKIYGNPQKPKTKKEAFKDTFPYVTFSGTFSSRANDNIIDHSGYICIDLDHVGENGQIKNLQHSIKEKTTPLLMFVSPSGTGLKVVFAIDINQGTHIQYYKALETFFKKNFSLDTDPQCKDVSRACFLCHDPDVILTDEPSVLGERFLKDFAPPTPTERKVPVKKQMPVDANTLAKQFQGAVNYANTKTSFTPGSRNGFITEVAAACHRFNVPEDYTLQKCLKYAEEGFPVDEIEKTVKNIYSNPRWTGIANSDVPDENICPYIRVGVDYFKVINKKDRYGIERRELKRWTKDALITDYKRGYLKSIPKYDDFVQVPDNQNYQGVINNCYNMYAPFCHTPAPGEWKWTKILLEQVFGEQYELGLRYMQILYCYPKRPAPILVLVSSRQKTGKTTFVNWISMLFGSNAALINAGDFQSMFNGQYATKNIVMIEETLFDKKITIERLKAIATAKQISVNRKNIDQFNLDYFGKIILTSNFEDKFAQISTEETRFFVRKLGEPKFKRNTIEIDLLTEIPAFLDYLASLPPVSDEVDRSGFTSEELRNEFLDAVKEESKHETSKELKIMFAEYFENHENITEFYASATDIKTKFFAYDNRTGIAWLLRVLKDDFGLNPGKLQKYIPFGDPSGVNKAGRPYCFNRNNFTKDRIDETPF